MHGLSLIAALILSVAASPVQACVPFQFVSAVAHGKVRTAGGVWADITMETDRSLVRIEYSSSKAPGGRFVIVGNVDKDWAYGFPANAATYSAAPLRVSMQHLLVQAGLPAWAFAQQAYPNDPLRHFGGRSCRLTAMKADWPFRGEPGARVCAHDVWAPYAGGLPLFALDSHGRRVLEMSRVDLGLVRLDRFNPPRPLGGRQIVTARTAQTCSA